MSSELIVDELTGRASAGSIAVTAEGGTNTTNLQQGLAKSFWDLNGTGTIALQDSFNVSSVADLGTGYYQINYNNIFNSINNVPLSHTFNHVDYDTTLTNGKNASLALFYTFKSTNGTIQDSKPFGATFGDLA